MITPSLQPDRPRLCGGSSGNLPDDPPQSLFWAQASSVTVGTRVEVDLFGEWVGGTVS